MIELSCKPNDSRGFLHRRILGGVKGFIGGGFTGAARGFLAPTEGSAREQQRAARGPLPSRFPVALPDPGRVGRLPCTPPLERGPTRRRLEKIFPGGRTGFETVPRDDFGAAVMGAFGMPALEPAVRESVTLRCPPGMVLGKDELCYPRSVLRRDSRFRKWRPGVRPILTGGQRAAIRKARTAVTTARDAIAGLGVTVKKTGHK